MRTDVRTNQCRECAAARPHCHGTLINHLGINHLGIHHWGQAPECTEPDCDHPEILLHSLTVDCDAIGCACGEGAAHRAAV